MLVERLHHDDVTLLRQIDDASSKSTFLGPPHAAVVLTHGRTYLLPLEAVGQLRSDEDLRFATVISMASLS
jgi:hypothetical protein